MVEEDDGILARESKHFDSMTYLDIFAEEAAQCGPGYHVDAAKIDHFIWAKVLRKRSHHCQHFSVLPIFMAYEQRIIHVQALVDMLKLFIG
jgi:hypothetical protein